MDINFSGNLVEGSRASSHEGTWRYDDEAKRFSVIYDGGFLWIWSVLKSVEAVRNVEQIWHGQV
jgi:hypothetical protein